MIHDLTTQKGRNAYAKSLQEQAESILKFHKSKNMNYSQYLFSCLIKLYDSEFEQMEYDIQFYDTINEYEIFENSNFNDGNKSEYECIVNYLNDKYGKR